MSYDLMVFDPAAAPRSQAAFHQWWEEQQSGEEDTPPSDEPKSLTPRLQAWFAEMIELFPPLNGPLSRQGDDEDDDGPRLTDYGLARTYVYACFAWSQAAAAAHEHTSKLAEKHGVGLFDVSSEEGAIWIPGPQGQLVRMAE